MNTTRFYIVFSCMLFILLTNNWMGWDYGITTMFAPDVHSYEIIARAAPSLPQIQTPYHHAQRLFFPYVAGLISKAANVPVEIVFSVLTGTFICATVLLIHLCFRHLKLSEWNYIFCMSVLILNPYLLRFYMIVPGMLPDMTFVAGLSMTLLGLIDKRFPLVFCGALVAALGRQTAIVMIPGLIFWLYKVKGWNDNSLKEKMVHIAATLITIISVYIFSGGLVSGFTSPSINIGHVTDILLLFSRDINAERLLAYISYIIVPLLVPMAVMAGASLASQKQLKLPADFWAALLLAAGIIAQPILAGPFSSISQGARLSSLSIPALLTSVSFLLKEIEFIKEGKKQFIWKLMMICVLITGSLHYRYTIIGPSNLAQFVIIQVLVSAAVCVIVYSLVRKQVD